MSGYIGTKASVVSSGAERKKVFDITTTTTSLTGCSYTPNQVHVFHNGVRLVDGTDYTATNGTSLTLTTAAQNGDEVVVISYATFQTSDTVSASAGGTFSGDITINGSLSVDGGTIKLDGNYPVGTNNVALGDIALGDASLSGGNNTAIGRSSLFSNTSGSSNTGIGSGALENNTTASNNTAVGYQALLANTATGNNAIGYTALRSNTTGAGNTADGVNALYSNTTGSNNTSMGFQSLLSSTTASNNIAVGYQALLSNTTGSENTAIGKSAGISLTTGTVNTFVGFGSGNEMTTGSKNVILGSYDGNGGGLDIRTSSNNIVLSDGDGNPRLRIDQNGRAILQSTYLGFKNNEGTIAVFTGYANIASTFSVTIPTVDASSILVSAAINHYGLILGYGAARLSYCSVGSGGGEQVNIYNHNTGNGGSWSFGPGISSITITHNAGSYAASGYYTIFVVGNFLG